MHLPKTWCFGKLNFATMSINYYLSTNESVFLLTKQPSQVNKIHTWISGKQFSSGFPKPSSKTEPTSSSKRNKGVKKMGWTQFTTKKIHNVICCRFSKKNNLNPFKWPNSGGFWCCVFITLWITLLWSTWIGKEWVR